MFVMSWAIVALLSLCFSFLCFGLLVRTQSRPCGLCHCPYTLAHIKGFGSSSFTCLCFLAFVLYACSSLSSSRLRHVWRPSWAWPCVVTSDAHEVMDIRSKPTFVHRGNHLLFASCLFVFLRICLLSCLLACLLAFSTSCLFVYHVA